QVIGFCYLRKFFPVFNYFNRQGSSLGPAQTTENNQKEQQDVATDNLPGKYKVKEGDTLFIIAEKYYKDGEKFSEIAKANNLSNPDTIEAGTIIEIPKLASSLSPAASPEASTEPSPSVQTSTETPQPTQTAEAATTQNTSSVKETEWGPVITSTSYTVVEGDWLSKIAGRAYGDIFAYQKIAQANNISNPDLIEPGTVLTIPR
ncbi:MAG: LysM peptidoglycan-binding domain-containing protein, partial [Patescibacteria group bacterium]|nr:LysM peptidoglycan-binding domain-containing protein [Patescibacteria group bacterium]